MTNCRKLILMLFMVLFLWSCDESKKAVNENVDDENNEIAVRPRKTDVVTGYIQLKDALVATDVDAAQAAGGDFKSIVTGNVDAAYEKALLSVTDKIIVSQDIEEQRKYFEQISELIYALAQNGQFEGKTLYKQYCPMAFNDKGAYWLSLDDEILNPYFGEKMLKCGYVEEIL